MTFEAKNVCCARATVVCPYYIADDCKRTIRCEGPMDGAKLDVVFDSKPQMQFHLEGWCSSESACKKCEVYRMLSEKYREDGA